MIATVLEFGEFTLDRGRFELGRNGRAIALERKPMELLILLAERNGQLVTRAEIARASMGARSLRRYRTRHQHRHPQDPPSSCATTPTTALHPNRYRQRLPLHRPRSGIRRRTADQRERPSHNFCTTRPHSLPVVGAGLRRRCTHTIRSLAPHATGALARHPNHCSGNFRHLLRRPFSPPSPSDRRSQHPLSRRPPSRQPLRRSESGLLRRRHDRRAHHHARQRLHPPHRLAHLRYAVQGRPPAAARNCPRPQCRRRCRRLMSRSAGNRST